MSARFRSFGMVVRLLTMAVLLTAVLAWPPQARAQEPAGPVDPAASQISAPATPQPSGLIRHKPGRLSRVTDLDVRMAAGETEDPLGANSTIITWDKIAMSFQAETTQQFTTKTYDVDTNLGNPIAKAKNTHGVTVAGSGSMDIASGYLGGTAGWIDSVTAFESPAGYISLYTSSYNSSLGINAQYLLNHTADTVAGGAYSGWPGYGALIRVATGDFDADGYDEFVVAWEGANKSLNLRVWDTNGGLTPTAKGKIVDEVLGGYKFLSVTTGDFNADGRAEIAVVWQGSDKYLAVKVYSVTVDGNLVAEVKTTSTAVPGQVSVKAGDFNGDAIDEFVVAYNLQTSVVLNVYKVTDNLHTLTAASTLTVSSGEGQPTISELVGRQLGLGAGDFNADGVDELTMVYGAPKKWNCNVSALRTDAALVLAAKSTIYSSWLTCYGDVSVAVGDLNRDSIDEVAVASVVGGILGTNDVESGLFQVAPDLLSITEKGHLQDETVGDISYNFAHVRIAVGAYDDKSVRVGAPTYSHMAQVKQLVAVINAPPKHEDDVNGEAVDVNVSDRCTIPPCTYARYETESKTTTKMQLTTSRDWSVSEDAELKFPHVKTSLKASYGESFEKTTTSFKSTEFGQDIEANEDDAIVRLEQGLNVWEYPVYADGTDQVQGHILVVWPDKVDPACSTNCVAAMTARIDGKTPTSYYLPNHEIDNVLSYSPEPPADISTTVKSDVINYLGPNAYQMWVKWSDVEETETKQSSKLDLEASLEVSGWGQHLTTSGSYAQGETSVNTVGFETSTEIHVYFFTIEQKFSYGVRPILYWANPDGHLVLDYVVQPLTASPATWWQTTYNKPDPTFNLPYKNGSMGEEYREFSKEISFSKSTAVPGDLINVTAKVRNYSLIGVNNVPVRFYIGDPDNGGTPIPGGDFIVSKLNPMGSALATVAFDTTGQPTGILNIYAVVDPDHTINEVHEEFNKAYGQLALNAWVAAPPGPVNLYITEQDIAVDPGSPAAGQTVYITATVHAMYQPFAFVGIEFWDGNPQRGGTYIGGRIIPAIGADKAASVSVPWDTAGSLGEHQIWAILILHADDGITTDNSAYRTIQLQPYQLRFPVVFK